MAKAILAKLNLYFALLAGGTLAAHATGDYWLRDRIFALFAISVGIEALALTTLWILAIVRQNT